MADNMHTNQKMPALTRGGGGGGGAARFAPGKKAKDAKGTLERIVRIYLQWGRTVFAAMLLTALSSLIAVAIPYFTGRVFNIFDVETRSVDETVMMKLLAAVLLLYGANWLVTTAGSVIMLRVSQKLVYVLRTEFFKKMQKLPLAFYDTHSHGDTMSRLTNDVDNISTTIAQSATQLISSILTLAGSLIVMFALNIWLTLVVLLCVPLVAGLTGVITKRSRSYFLSQQISLGALNGIVEEDILGLKMVKAFGRQEEESRRFAEQNESLCENSRKAQIWAGFMMPVMNVINNLIFALVAIIGGFMSARGVLLVGTVVSFLSYSKQFSHPLNAIAGMFNTIQQALAGAERVFEILDESEEELDAENAVQLKDPVGDVEFANVCFSYQPGKEILKNINFHVKPGEVVALVGETGAGKTTIVNLLTRFYDADSGSILLDGTDIRNIKRSSLNKYFSVVLQDTCLFTGTIMDNIRYSNTVATDEEVVRAARLAHAHEFIERLPKGYQTMVSGSMDNLSQGQRQLLAIARAALCDTPILILDEATSSVDTKTEKDIQRAMLHLMEHHTSFLIAHRLSTIRDADRIMVIGEGCIQEMGNHEELMEKKGIYCQMVTSQMGEMK
ncbi:ABC transporter ATP-binding protein [Murimonas intestini]|uniref:ATP-binding cassette subfamily B protein n=1 Tax=Murimonas intestini TaxID=1337051 RepID=A0AB73T9D2_9FIRM|nr:ABC transporter ATP-binding protein [Murimonas intestini]MCR1839295.1 ABC transporter ATP-binding protein/permease [Murimonas intestini]MCR1864590.1 ABC transporter ATP-binding protein/permease [Murimonas intestini]MCR1882200.1 ABC transporter ATP-binding protein/permease [Murimonas intestini]